MSSLGDTSKSVFTQPWSGRMSHLDEFLKANQSLVPDESNVSTPGVGVTINAMVSRVSSERVVFFHQSARFTISRRDVLDISDDPSPAPVPSGEGKAVVLQIQSNALVANHSETPVLSFALVQPFAFRNSGTPVAVSPPRGTDIAWRLRVGYPLSAMGNADISETVTDCIVDGRVQFDDSAVDD
jgi:hypothetical protein